MRRASGKEKDIKQNRKEWSELFAALNWNDFKKVNVNTRAICVEGCDTRIFIENSNGTHQIRFAENSPEIEPVRTFIEKLKCIACILKVTKRHQSAMACA